MVDLHKQELSRNEIVSRVISHFLKISFLLSFFPHIFAITNQLPGFSTSRKANVENFFNVNVFFKCEYKCEYK